MTMMMMMIAYYFRSCISYRSVMTREKLRLALNLNHTRTSIDH